MRLNKFSLLVFGLLLSVGNSLYAEVVLPKVIGHNMVLQRRKAVSIWGTAAKGEKVTVTFAGQQRQAVANDSGKWEVKLKPMEASADAREMVIQGKNSIKLENILVGEVWFCSGQSNMEYAMRKNSKFFDKVKGSHPVEDDLETAKNSNIRIFISKRKFMSPDPEHKGWEPATGAPLRDFSAAGYYFAKELYQKLNIPIGMIEAAVPGSRIEPWIQTEKLAVSPKMKDGKIMDQLSAGKGEDGKFYDTMVEPLIPFTLKGFLWYQGESGCFLNEDIRYAYKFKTLIESWRHDWRDAKLPFYFVQIAPYQYSVGDDGRGRTVESLPKFWEAQALALRLPNTGMATITDLVDSIVDLHPPYKWEVGRRLSLIALNKTYGFREMESSGPMYKSMKVEGDKIEITFTHTGSGLMSRDGKPLTCFTIAGVEGKFIPAKAVINGNKVIVSAEGLKHPYTVRFAWHEAAQSNFINKEGLPAVPFRSDNPWLKLF